MRRIRRNVVEESEGTADWMLTYSDLVTLLLTFFIMLFSMATVDKQKFEDVAKSLRSSFLHMSNGEMLNTNQGKDITSVTGNDRAAVMDAVEINREQGGEKEHRLDDIKEQVQKAIIDMKLEGLVKVVDQKDEIILRFNSILLFDLGSAEIKPSGKDALGKIGTLLKQVNNDIMVQGHTDDLPIETVLYPTNWELSTKRATNVVLFLINDVKMSPEKLTATGNGEFKPVAPNDSETNRQKNRRIDIVIVK